MLFPSTGCFFYRRTKHDTIMAHNVWIYRDIQYKFNVQGSGKRQAQYFVRAVALPLTPGGINILKVLSCLTDQH
jgi:hypothetical protein